jgi:hypothetical protein
MRFTIIVDDIKHYADIKKGQNGVVNGSWLKCWWRKLYGGGTFAHKVTCKCKDKHNGTPCKLCDDKKEYVRIDCPLDHLFTTALFATTCVLIYWALGRNAISFTAAVLYAVNPINNQTSIWLNGRRYSVNIILTLLMLLSVPLGILFYFMTPLLQVNALLSPVLLGGWYLLAIPVVLYTGRGRFVAFFNTRMKDIVNQDMRRYDLGRLVIVVKTFGFYVGKMIFPGRCQMVYPFISEWGMTKTGNAEAYRIDRHFWAGVISLALVAAGLVFLPSKEKWYLLFLALSTLQFCNIITPTQTAADRYVSMPNVFMSYFIAYIAITYFGSLAAPVLVALIVSYVHGLNTVMRMYQDIYRFYEYHNYFYPENTILRKFRINWLIKTNDVIGAWELIKTGLAYNPKDFSMLYMAGLCMSRMGDTVSSEKFLDEAEKNHYINQEPLWRNGIMHIRNMNLKVSAPKVNGKNRIARQPSEWKGK